MLSLRGIKARPHDLATMVALGPSLVELHCSVDDLEWMPNSKIDIPMALHVPEYTKGYLLDPASLDEDTRKRASNIYVRAVGRATAWAPFFKGKPKVIFHPGGMSLEPVSALEKTAMNLALDRTIEDMIVAAAGDVDILIENLPAHCWFFGGDWLSNIITTGTELRDAAERNGIAATLDLCHLYLASQEHRFDPIDQIEEALPVVRHIHYSDGEGVSGEGLQIGSGNMPLALMFSFLMHLDAVAVPEIWYGHEHEGAGFVEAWARAENIMRIEARKEEVV